MTAKTKKQTRAVLASTLAGLALSIPSFMLTASADGSFTPYKDYGAWADASFIATSEYYEDDYQTVINVPIGTHYTKLTDDQYWDGESGSYGSEYPDDIPYWYEWYCEIFERNNYGACFKSFSPSIALHDTDNDSTRQVNLSSMVISLDFAVMPIDSLFFPTFSIESSSEESLIFSCNVEFFNFATLQWQGFAESVTLDDASFYDYSVATSVFMNCYSSSEYQYVDDVGNVYVAVRNLRLSYDFITPIQPGQTRIGMYYDNRYSSTMDLNRQQRDVIDMLTRVITGGGEIVYTPKSPLDNIMSFVDTFFNTDIFPNFSIGDMLLIALGTVLFGMFLKIFVGG